MGAIGLHGHSSWNSRGSSVMTPSQPSARMRSMPARVFTVQARTRPPLLVHGGDGLGGDDVMSQRGVAGAGPGMDVGRCDTAPGHPNRPGVIVALVRAWSLSAASEAQLAGREHAPVGEAGASHAASVSRS